MLDQDVPELVDDMLEIAGWIDPDARGWLEAQTGAAEIARQLSRFTSLPAGAA
jgi:nitrous oxide reductase accessory protein NosL